MSCCLVLIDELFNKTLALSFLSSHECKTNIITIFTCTNFLFYYFFFDCILKTDANRIGLYKWHVFSIIVVRTSFVK